MAACPGRLRIYLSKTVPGGDQGHEQRNEVVFTDGSKAGYPANESVIKILLEPPVQHCSRQCNSIQLLFEVSMRVNCGNLFSQGADVAYP